MKLLYWYKIKVEMGKKQGTGAMIRLAEVRSKLAVSVHSSEGSGLGPVPLLSAHSVLSIQKSCSLRGTGGCQDSPGWSGDGPHVCYFLK